MMTTTATATMMTKTMMMTTIMIRTATETTMKSMATSSMMRMRMEDEVVAASAPIEVRGILCVELLHESQNALPDVREKYPSTFDASCAVMLAPITSSREGEDGARFQANTSTSSSSSSSRRTYSRCAPRAASTIRTRRLLPPRRISRTRRSRGSRICTASSPRRSPRTRHPSRPTLP